MTLKPELRAAATPKVNADRNIGAWNSMEITLAGDTATVVLNSRTVIDKARMPGLPPTGPIGLQHHGKVGKDGQYEGPPSLIQFRNLQIKEL
jgi:hypothetical protein